MVTDGLRTCKRTLEKISDREGDCSRRDELWEQCSAEMRGGTDFIHRRVSFREKKEMSLPLRQEGKLCK